jgi:phosphoribosyl 1,2-cyclic phosphodiesterase
VAFLFASWNGGKRTALKAQKLLVSWSLRVIIPAVRFMPTASSIPARIKFWGVRGSIPVPGSDTLRYGGNTTCVEFRADGEIVVLDAGTGIRGLGAALEEEFGSRPINLTLLITHMHWDHIQGFPFFVPSYSDKNSIRVMGYDGSEAGLRDILVGQMATPFFPVELEALPSRIEIEKLQKYEFNIGKIKVRAKLMNHPGVCVGYRLDTSEGSIAFLPDNEPYDGFKIHSMKSASLAPEEMEARAKAARTELVEFLQGCDVLILDTQYTDEEYKSHVGWGHGWLSATVKLALDAGVKKLVLFHHDPTHDDNEMDAMAEEGRKLVAASGKKLEMEVAREGLETTLRPARNGA